MGAAKKDPGTGDAPEKLPSVLLTAAECMPFAKTGGLADVVGTLAKELKSLGFDVRVMMPLHRIVKEKLRDQVRHLVAFSAELGWRSQYAGVELYDWAGIPCYFIDNENYFDYEIYKGGKNEGEQYAFFTRAMLEALPMIGFIPDILHVNDWHTAMAPMLIKTQYGGTPQGSIRTVLTIHNLGFQGKYDFGFVSDLFGIDGRYYTSEYMESYGSANFLKSGIVFADRITTVSPTYAGEIQTDTYGEGLNGILSARSGSLEGILNGIDTAEFDPGNDALIPNRYGIDTLEEKQKDKEALLYELGLKITPDTPLVTMVSRLTPQKGIDLIRHIFDELMQENVGFALLGSGDREYEDFFRSAEERYKGRVCSSIQYDEQRAHRLYAGGDYLLMPSWFEPCGLSQMIALRYGTLPIVRATGGLKDTVAPYNRYTGEGNGFTFENYNAHDLLNTVRYGLSIYREEAFTALRKKAMSGDYGFKLSAQKYADLYKRLCD
jgi:starch synthase